VQLGLFLRIVIALTALGLFAGHVWWPELKIDMTALALLAVAMIVIFGGPNLRIGALNLGGFKLEFDQASSEKPSAATSAHQPARSAEPSFQPVLGDSYFARVAKLTPSEMVAAYLMIITMAKTSPNMSPTIGIVIFVFFLIACFVFYGFALYNRILGTAWLQATVMTLSFAAWAYALEFPFATLGWYSPAIASLALAVVIFTVPVVYPAVQDGFGQ
jgi:hypothetical protein